MKTFITCCSLFLFVSISYGQEFEDLTPKKFDDVEWYGRSLFKFEMAKYDSVMLVLKNHFLPAFREVGIDVELFTSIGGEWHAELQFQLKGGPADLEWQVQPWFPDFLEILNSQEGGEKALPYWTGALRDSGFQLLMKRTW